MNAMAASRRETTSKSKVFLHSDGKFIMVLISCLIRGVVTWIAIIENNMYDKRDSGRF